MDGPGRDSYDDWDEDDGLLTSSNHYDLALGKV